jgi:hypothetical protein
MASLVARLFAPASRTLLGGAESAELFSSGPEFLRLLASIVTASESVTTAAGDFLNVGKIRFDGALPVKGGGADCATTGRAMGDCAAVDVATCGATDTEVGEFSLPGCTRSTDAATTTAAARPAQRNVGQERVGQEKLDRGVRAVCETVA